MGQPSGQPQPDEVPGRVPRLRSATLTRQPGSGLHVRVELEHDGGLCAAEARGFGSDTVELRLAADATIEALREATEGRIDLRLRGIKRVQAFDAYAVLVSVRVDADRPGRLVGAAVPRNGNMVEAAAAAVLSALAHRAGSAPRPTPGPRLVPQRPRPAELRLR